jgi:hypothetical protein
MTIKSHPNIEILENALLLLGPLADEMVFIGGCPTVLLITDPGANPIRATIDFEAFDGRGEGDYLLSRDMEDIIFVLDGRPEIIEEVKGAETELKQYLKDRLAGLLKNQNFIEALPGHLPPDSASQARIDLIISRIEKMIER